MVQEKDLANLWEEMGASTGAFIGRFIGLNAQMGLQVIDGFLAPLANMTPKGQNAKPPLSNTKEQTPAQGNVGIRTEVWQQMGLQYGTKIGESLGLAQDLLVQTIDFSVEEPLNNMVNNPPNNLE